MLASPTACFRTVCSAKNINGWAPVLTQALTYLHAPPCRPPHTHTCRLGPFGAGHDASGLTTTLPADQQGVSFSGPDSLADEVRRATEPTLPLPQDKLQQQAAAANRDQLRRAAAALSEPKAPSCGKPYQSGRSRHSGTRSHAINQPRRST